MESQKPKIALYVKRPFGDKLNATMDFIKENWKPMLKFSTYLILPLCLIQAISMNGIMGGTMGFAAACAVPQARARQSSRMNAQTLFFLIRIGRRASFVSAG